MELTKKKEGFGYLIKWIIRLGDLLIINAVLLLLSKFLGEDAFYNARWGEIFLLINLIYLVVAGIVPIYVSSNIIFFDKIVHRSFSFISLYFNNKTS